MILLKQILKTTTLIFLILFLALFRNSNAAQITELVSDEPSVQEWVVVLKDPRPARLQGWNNNRYRGNSSYHSSDFKRFGIKFAKNNDLKLKQEWFIESLSVYCLIVEFMGDTETTLVALNQNKHVEWVQKSNDFELLNSKGLRVNKPSKSQYLSDLNYDGDGIVIAMIDSGVDQQHRDLIHAIKDTEDFVITNSAQTRNKYKAEIHGTAIAGVLIAQPNFKLGISGIAPAAKLLAFRGCWEEENKNTHCNTLSLARALDAVIKSAPDILNLSLSGPEDKLLNQLIGRIVKNQTIVVAAFDPSRSNKKRFPALRNGVLIVRAESLNNEFNDIFSAPGSHIVPSPNDSYSFQSGHSIASAHTSGLLALLTQAVAHNPGIRPKINDVINGDLKSIDNLLNYLR